MTIAYTNTESFEEDPEFSSALLYIIGHMVGAFIRPLFSEQADRGCLRALRKVFPRDHKIWNFVSIIDEKNQSKTGE